jgi:hypothetical protein
MKCSQSKPFTMTSTNPKMGGPAVRSYEKGGIVEGSNPNIDEDVRERARRFVAGSESGAKPVAASGEDKSLDYAARYERYADDNERARTIPGPRFMAAASAKDKPPVVTKEELEKSGLSLRDYMNKQQGLTRRGAPAANTSNAYGKEQQYQRAQEAEQTPEGKAKRAAMEKSQALERSYPLENMVGGAAGVGIKTIAKLAQNLANRGGGAKTVVKRLERVEPTFRERELEIIKEVPRELPGRAKQLALPSPVRKK